MGECMQLVELKRRTSEKWNVGNIIVVNFQYFNKVSAHQCCFDYLIYDYGNVRPIVHMTYLEQWHQSIWIEWFAMFTLQTTLTSNIYQDFLWSLFVPYTIYKVKYVKYYFLFFFFSTIIWPNNFLYSKIDSKYTSLTLHEE